MTAHPMAVASRQAAEQRRAANRVLAMMETTPQRTVRTNLLLGAANRALPGK